MYFITQVLLHLAILSALVALVVFTARHVKSASDSERVYRVAAILIGFALVLGSRVTGENYQNLIWLANQTFPLKIPYLGPLVPASLGAAMMAAMSLASRRHRHQVDYLALIAFALLFGLFADLYATSWAQSQRDTLQANLSFAIGGALYIVLARKLDILFIPSKKQDDNDDGNDGDWRDDI